MRVPLSWLRDYVEVSMPLEQLAERLAVTAAEVEAIEQFGVPETDGNLGRFAIGKVLDVSKHPNADRLSLCVVDVGEGEPRQIVCGADNVIAGGTVGVALSGAVVRGGLRIEDRDVRGIVSRGMILSDDEAGVGDSRAGIMLLPDDLEAGQPLVDALPIAERVLVVEVTGNRPDLFSIYGIAREVAAIFDLPLAPEPGGELVTAADPGARIRIDDEQGCLRYIGGVLQDVTVAPSPQWLRTRLWLGGMRPISNVVDVTNYVMLTLGSPLHAFDLTSLRGAEIIVRRAAAGERIRTLDGDERELDATDLVIADAERPIAIAGIMGGEETEVGAETNSVLLEAANFDRFTIYSTSERLKLRTEASSRWEKGVDPHAAERAAAYATDLIVELAGARNAGALDVHGTLPDRPVVRYRPERANALIGLTLPEEQQRGILQRLGFESQGGDVVVPTWRAAEVTREVDLIEEVARFVLDDVPFTLPARREMVGQLTALQQVRRRVEDALVGLGLSETYTPSLRGEQPGPKAYELVEPISVDLTYLRTSLLPSLVDTAARNAEAGNERIDLFEVARVYLPSGEPLPDEHVHVAAILEGGFLRAKGVVETVDRALKIEAEFTRGTHPLMHPGKTAQLPFGFVGELRPGVLEGDWSVFELDLAALAEATTGPVIYEDVVTYPAVKQDLAFVLDEDVPTGDVIAAMREAAGSQLRSVRLFDVYRGGQIAEGRKSLAFSVSFQSPERTLSDEDAVTLRTSIVDALAKRFSAELRE